MMTLEQRPWNNSSHISHPATTRMSRHQSSCRLFVSHLPSTTSCPWPASFSSRHRSRPQSLAPRMEQKDFKRLPARATLCRHFSTNQRVSFSLSSIYVQVLFPLMNQFFSFCCSLGQQYCSSYSLKNWCPWVKNLPPPLQFFYFFFREPISHHLFTISFTILCSALPIRFLRLPRNNNWHTYLPTASPLFFSKLPTINFKPAKRIHHIQIHP